MVLIATLTATLVTDSGRSAWFVGVSVLMYARRGHSCGERKAGYSSTIRATPRIGSTNRSDSGKRMNPWAA